MAGVSARGTAATTRGPRRCCAAAVCRFSLGSLSPLPRRFIPQVLMPAANLGCQVNDLENTDRVIYVCETAVHSGEGAAGFSGATLKIN